MSSSRFYFFSVVFLFSIQAAVGVFGQTENSAAASENNPVSAVALPKERPERAKDLIHFGDLIEIDLVGSVEYDWRGSLSPEGFLEALSNLERSFYGLCREVDQVAREIELEYAKTLRDPRVVVRILDRSKRPEAYIYGAVKLPQRFAIKRPIRLSELIILSGGLTDRTSGEIQIFRSPGASCAPVLEKENKVPAGADSNKEERLSILTVGDNGSNFITIQISDLLKGDKRSNPWILSGDVITVREAEPVYVVGGVANPKTVSWRQGITLTRALATAGSLTDEAVAAEITIFRREAGQTEILRADLEKIKSGRAEDVSLKPFDIVDVPEKGGERRKYSRLTENFKNGPPDKEKLPLRIID